MTLPKKLVLKTEQDNVVDGLGVDRFDINKDMVLRDKSFVVDVVRNESLERVMIGDNFIKPLGKTVAGKLFVPRSVVKVEVSENSFSEKAWDKIRRHFSVC